MQRPHTSIALFLALVIGSVQIETAFAQNPTAGKQLPEDLRKLFALLDDLGRAPVKDAKFIELSLTDPQAGRAMKKDAWLLEEKADSITVLQDDLLPWTYAKDKPTIIPSSWQPRQVTVAFKEVDFEAKCKELAATKKENEPRGRLADIPGPSYRAIMAHATWKRGLPQYCTKIIDADPNRPNVRKDPDQYQGAVLEDLAWLHFLRGVNLLMYADRKEVLPQLQLVSKISPHGEFAEQAGDLAERLEKLIAQKNRPAKVEDETKLNPQQRAELYVSQLVDLWCPQMSQPGFIMPYLAIVDLKPDQQPASAKLRDMGMDAVPALLKALDDDTPTRTVYHWRDFAKSRLVWRVSDFAWNILRDVSKKDLGYQRVVGFTLGSMKPEEKRQAILEAKKWYAGSKNLSEDDRMFAFFSTQNPTDWITAGQYFSKKKDNRAVAPLVEKIKQAESFEKGTLCELVASFGDKSALPAIQQVMKSAQEPSDRLHAAIALWMLGDNSGIPLAIEYVKAKEPAYGSWDDPVWFLLRTRNPEGMAALKKIVADAPAPRAGEVVEFIIASITGDLDSREKEPAGCVEVCPVLIAAMDRGAYTGGTFNNTKLRVKDIAAKAMIVLREGNSSPFGGRFVEVDPKFFNQDEPDEAKRDEQIRAIQDWYAVNHERLVWDAEKKKLAVKGE